MIEKYCKTELTKGFYEWRENIFFVLFERDEGENIVGEETVEQK